MTGNTDPQDPKPVVRAHSRPSTLEEDEWAIDWVQRQWKIAYANELGCLSVGLLFVGGIVAGVGFYNFGRGVGFSLLGIGVVVWGAFLIAYLRRRQKAPSVLAGEPLGTIETLSLPVVKAWRVNMPSFGNKKNGLPWVIRVTQGIHVFFDLGEVSDPRPLISGSMPGARVEFDYYHYEKRGAVKLQMKQLLAVRIKGQLEAYKLGEVLDRPPYLCSFLNSSYPDSFREGGYDVEPRYADEALLEDLEHPVFREFCTVIRSEA